MSIENPTVTIKEGETRQEAERREKEQAWLQLHLWMHIKLQGEREQLVPGEYVRPESVLSALQEYRTLPESEGWKTVGESELEPDWKEFFQSLRDQGRTGEIGGRKTDNGPIEEYFLPEGQVMRNIAMLGPEIEHMEAALAGQSQEPLDVVSQAYVASWAIA